MWVIEGTATWAALSVHPVPYELGGGNLTDYLGTPATHLFSRVYDGVGFWGHLEETTGDLFPRMATILRAALSGDEAAYDVAGADATHFLETWGSSAFDLASLGQNWTMSRPLKVPPFLSPPPVPLTVSRSVVETGPYTVAHYLIVTDSYPPAKPLMHFRIPPPARLGNTVIDTPDLSDRWFCLNGKCECPAGYDGNPPPATPIGEQVSFLALTGGRRGVKGLVTVASLEEFCKKKEKKPPPPANVPPISNQAPAPPGSGGGGKSGCAGRCGGSNGDPHLTTFDGRFYDFQGAGEYTLVRSTEDSLEVQVREQPYPGSNTLAINTAIALRVGTDRIVVSSGRPLPVRVNGSGFVPVQPTPLPGGGRIARVGDQLEITWPEATVARLWSVGWYGVAVLLSPVDARKGKLAGLLGDFDGSTENDFKTRDGRLLGEIAGSRPRLYGTFGESWRISQQASLFDYAPGQSTCTFTNRRFPGKIETVDSLPKRERRGAEAVCRTLRIADRRIFDVCVLDVAGTGDNSFATAGATLERTAGSFGAAPSTGGRPGSGGKGVGDKRWAAISTGGSNATTPSIALDSGKVVVAYGSGAQAEAATFTPSLSRPAGRAQARPDHLRLEPGLGAAAPAQGRGRLAGPVRRHLGDRQPAERSAAGRAQPGRHVRARLTRLRRARSRRSGRARPRRTADLGVRTGRPLRLPRLRERRPRHAGRAGHAVHPLDRP